MFLKQLIIRICSYLGIKITKLGKKNDIDLYLQIYGEESVRSKRFYNISAGGHSRWEHVVHPLWTRIDLIENDSDKSDGIVNYDMMADKPLPIETGSAEIILTQYAIEHVPEENVEFFFKEAFRALKPGGVLRVVAPNTDLDYLAYSKNNRSFYTWENWMGTNFNFKTLLKEASFEQLVVSHIAGNASEMHIGDNPNKISDIEIKKAFKTLEKEDFYNFCTSHCSVEVQRKFRENHFSWWTHDKLKIALNKSGFKEVYTMYPNQSSAEVLTNHRYFDNKWNFVALFVEAIKR